MNIILIETEDEAKKGINNPHVEKLEDNGHTVDRLVIKNEQKDAWIITSPELDGVGIGNITKQQKSIPEVKVYTNWSNFFGKEFVE